MSKLTALIDADIVAYKTASVNQHTIDWGEDIKSVSTESDSLAIYQADAAIETIMEETGATSVILCLSDSENFRKSIYPEYKSNRKDTPKPLLLGRLREHLSQAYRCYQRPGLEGDDIIGILATHPRLIPGDKLMVSEDKDLRQIPGRLYNPRSGLYVNTSPLDGALWHMMQVLTGDPVDGYPGLPGIGPKKAEKLLHGVDPSRWWSVIVGAYEDKGLTEDDALQQAQVARICRYTDYDFKTHQVLPWLPESPLKLAA